MTRCLTTTLSVFALLLAGTFARGDVNDKVKAMQSPKDSKEFAMKAAEGGMLEVKLAQLAQQKTSNQEVKQLAQKIEQDHTQANNQLTTVAKQKNIDLPTDLRGECDELYQAFQKLEGKDFDNAYSLHLIKNHIKDIAMFQKESQNGTDLAIKQWATQTLPTLRQHASHISTVAQACGLPVDVFAGAGQREGARPAGSKIQGAGNADKDRENRSTDTGRSPARDRQDK
jgi:putative membrane protein